MYSECVSCPKLGVSCDGHNFVAMSAPELIAWCKARKAHLGYSNGHIAELAGMSKGTVDGVFASAHADFRFETIRPIVLVLIGGQFEGNHCPEPSRTERAVLENKIREMEKEISWRDDKIAHLQKNHEAMQIMITNTNKRNTESQAMLWEQIRNRTMVEGILAVLLGICLLCIMGALIVDGTNPNLGYIWLEGGMGNNALWFFLGVVALACVAIGLIVFFHGIKNKKIVKTDKGG